MLGFGKGARLEAGCEEGWGRVGRNGSAQGRPRAIASLVPGMNTAREGGTRGGVLD